jgi:ABC-type molybdate transport system substrate-binding protein
MHGAGVVGAAMAIVVVLAGSYLGYQRLSDSKCTGTTRLTVAAANEIAPAVQQTAQKWIQDGANVNGTCVAVSVTPIASWTMASAIAREHDVKLSGVGDASGSVKVPDVWIPDSDAWLLRLRSEAAGFLPQGPAKPLAQSPVVVAMPQPVAQTIGWPNKKLGWKDLLAQVTQGGNLRTGIVNPATDSAGLAALLALGQAAGADAAGQNEKVQAIKALAQSSSALSDDLLQKFPHSADPNDIATSLSAAPLSEQNVVSYNVQKPPVPLVPLYLQPSPPPLDYPFTVMPEAEPATLSLANSLLAQLQTPAFKNALGAAGLRAPDGSFGAGFDRPLGAPAASPAVKASSEGGSAAAGVDAGVVSQALGAWTAITAPGRALAVFDVSGSMAEKVPTAHGLTRAQVTQQAATAGLALFGEDWKVGTWYFSTDMNGKLPYKEAVPITPLVTGREKVQQAVGGIVPKPDGDTGLYDTVLAAYKVVQKGWEPGKVNSVILFTDGENENPEGITLSTLVSDLKKLNDPKRPVKVVIIGIGTEVNKKELETITNATPNGGTFVAPDPAKISDIFLQALANRSGTNG